MRVYVISHRCTVNQNSQGGMQYDLKWSTIITFAKCVLIYAYNRGRVDKG
jgi:hypothetical protein